MKRVEVFIAKAAANDDPNFFVSVNGTGYLLPRGKASKVPKEIADEVDRAQRAQNALDEKVEELVKK
ncbi:MAG: hypothetical protein IJ364_09110 [Oscillospiraceae bacterium]|nr:hypothetical protein [Oscillospiraceae bacterium]